MRFRQMTACASGEMRRTTTRLALDTLDKYIPSINAVTSEAVTKFAQKYLATPTSLVIVGQAPAFLDTLKKAYPEVKVIEQKYLDLNRADLVKANPASRPE